MTSAAAAAVAREYDRCHHLRGLQFIITIMTRGITVSVAVSVAMLPKASMTENFAIKEHKVNAGTKAIVTEATHHVSLLVVITRIKR